MPNIEDFKKEYTEVIAQLQDPESISDFDKFEELSKRKKFLDRIMDKQKELEDIINRLEENKSIIIAEEDEELITLAQAETEQLQAREKELREEVEKLLKEDDQPVQARAAIMEIRAGAGGEEAALFAAGLYNMYSRYAESNGWKLKVLESHRTELGGVKEIIFEISNGDVYSRMKNEGGVHRVQRIPETEKMGRVHTSTASVAVLPRPKKTDMKISPAELKIDVYRSSGPGGQNVNKRETAVRITHLPTGIVVSSQTERSQAQNKENAMAILSARILERREEERVNKLGGNRNEQIGSAKRSEKIRTYNFPQDRLTDHRIKKSWHGLEDIMDGKIDKIIETLQQELK
ncbi:MAG: peptide chain release factor 1 [bacterium]|nr:peptide chain release factor 1 [bacterium]